MRITDFNIERAKCGAKLVTRDGHEARIVCFDKLGEFPIIACIKCSDDYEDYESCDINGRVSGCYVEHRHDLFICSDTETTEFEKELDNIVTTFSKNRTTMDDNELRHYANKLMELAKKELLEKVNGLVIDNTAKGEESKKTFDSNVLEKHITDSEISPLAYSILRRNGWEVMTENEMPKWRPCGWRFDKWEISDEDGIPIISDGRGNCLTLSKLENLPFE